MNQDILDYINSQRVCVLAVEMPDGSPHAATLHFATSKDGTTFYFLTSPGYRKTEALKGRLTSRASVVVGVDEAVMKTMQLDGEVRIVSEAERKNFDGIYFGKFPEKVGKFAEDIAFIFTPTWWRYTDWTGANGKRIVSSADHEEYLKVN
jgi:uncharacterized protein YhbP (UPF0306 family)